MSSRANEFISSGAFEPAFQAIIPGASQVVAIGASSADSTVLGTNTTVVRLTSDQPCFVAFGSTPTATTSSHYLPANVPGLFGVYPGTKIAVIESGSMGSLYISEGL
jgi:hypothetical protein